MYVEDSAVRVGSGGRSEREAEIAATCAVVVATLVVYWLRGLGGALLPDNALYHYAAQQLSRGVPPYVGIFDLKTPLATFFTAIGVWLAHRLSLDELTAVRASYALVGLTTNLLLYRLGRRAFGSRCAALGAVLGLLTLEGLTYQTLAGPRPKVLLLPFIVGALLALVHRRWLAAGWLSALCLLTWQPAGIVGLAAGVVAAGHPGRGRALRRLAAGAAIPVVIVVGYFASVGAVGDLIDGTLRVPIQHLDHGTGPTDHICAALASARETFPGMLLPILGGLAYLPVRLLAKRGEPASERRDLFALVLVLALFVAWSIQDFQGYPDWFPLLPLAMLGFGAALCDIGRWVSRRHRTLGHVLTSAALVLLFGLALHQAVSTEQKGRHAVLARAVQQVLDDNGPGTSYLSFSPRFLAVSRFTNPTRHIVINEGIDLYIDESEEGGIEGWVGSLVALDADVIVAGATRGDLIEPLMPTLLAGRTRLRAGPLELWVKGVQ